MYPDYFDEDMGPYDEAAATLKDALKESIKAEITEELTALRTLVAEQKEKLSNLTALEQAAAAAQRQYQRDEERMRAEIFREVQQKPLQALFHLLADTKYCVNYQYIKQPKCNKCDKQRYVHYTTPLGKAAKEACTCSGTTKKYYIEEIYVKSVEKSWNDNRYLIWYQAMSDHPRYGKRDESYIDSSWFKESATGVETSKLLKSVSAYHFDSKEHAEQIRDMLNGQVLSDNISNNSEDLEDF